MDRFKFWILRFIICLEIRISDLGFPCKARLTVFCTVGFPHSDIAGSKVARHLPDAYRRHATSFIAFQSLGIHHTPLIYYPSKSEHKIRFGFYTIFIPPKFCLNKILAGYTCLIKFSSYCPLSAVLYPIGQKTKDK